MRSAVRRLPSLAKRASLALRLPLPLGRQCTGRRGWGGRGGGPLLPRTAVPARWAVRGEVGGPDRLAACVRPTGVVSLSTVVRVRRSDGSGSPRTNRHELVRKLERRAWSAAGPGPGAGSRWEVLTTCDCGRSYDCDRGRSDDRDCDRLRALARSVRRCTQFAADGRCTNLPIADGGHAS